MNYLDIDGFDWYNPAPNTSIVSMINLLNEALFYRRINLNPKLYTLAKPTPYRQFEYFTRIVNQMMDTHQFLNPQYLNVSLVNLSDRIEKIRVNEPFSSNSTLCILATTIYDWGDLESITGEDLTIFKDEKLRVNEVWGTGILTKMYKIVDAFYIKAHGSLGSHLTGEFIDIDSYIDYGNGTTRYTRQGVSTTDFYNSYSDDGYSIAIDPDLSYSEFINNLSIRQPKTINLTTQIRNGVVGDSNFFPSSKGWFYVRNKNFISGTNLARHRYQINQSLSYANACPLSPKFSRGNSTNSFQSQTEYYQYGERKNIDDINFYEYFFFYEKTNEEVDFGTGINLFDGGVLKYNHNQDSTLETDVFVNFDYVNSSLKKDPNMSEDIPTYGAQDELSMESRTYSDINNNPYNQYKTTPQE